MRVRIKVDINEPLKRGKNVKIGTNGGTKWSLITYEKLLDFCYYCGKLGHVFQECREEGAKNSNELNFGVSLRETRMSKGVYRSPKTAFRGHGFRGRGRDLQENGGTNKAELRKAITEQKKTQPKTVKNRRRRKLPAGTVMPQKG